MNGRTRILVLLACAISVARAASVSAQAPAAPPGTPKPAAPAAENAWKPEDVIFTETAGQFRVSPDSRWVVWVKGVANKDKDLQVTNLFISSLTEKKEIQLTRGTETHSQPRWSPSGELIAFLSTRPLPQVKPEASRSQLWLMNPFGGEPWSLTESERGIQRFEWVDADTILFSAEEDPTLGERELKRKKDDSRTVDDAMHTPPVRLFKLAVK